MMPKPQAFAPVEAFLGGGLSNPAESIKLTDQGHKTHKPPPVSGAEAFLGGVRGPPPGASWKYVHLTTFPDPPTE